MILAPTVGDFFTTGRSDRLFVFVILLHDLLHSPGIACPIWPKAEAAKACPFIKEGQPRTRIFVLGHRARVEANQRSRDRAVFSNMSENYLCLTEGN